jgi:hypothetical protein
LVFFSSFKVILVIPAVSNGNFYGVPKVVYRKRINWVKWDVVCQPKSLGGLGVKDIRAVNISLLAKWRWRLLKDDLVLWKEVLRGKFGESVIGMVCWA